MSTQTTACFPLIEPGEHQTALRPLGGGASLILFGLPASILFVSFHVFRPWLESLGYDSLASFLVSMGLPLALLFSAALFAYHKIERRPPTWLVHRLLWTCFHVFKWWDLLPLLPMGLITGYCAQCTRSTWGGLIGHALSNGISMIAILWFIVS